MRGEGFSQGGDKGSQKESDESTSSDGPREKVASSGFSMEHQGSSQSQHRQIRPESGLLCSSLGRALGVWELLYGMF